LYKKNKLYFAANVTGSPTVAAGCPSTKNSRGALRWGLPGIFVRLGETENGGSTTLRIFRPQKATSHGGEQLAGARDAWRVRHELATPTPRPPPASYTHDTAALSTKLQIVLLRAHQLYFVNYTALFHNLIW